MLATSEARNRGRRTSPLLALSLALLRHLTLALLQQRFSLSLVLVVRFEARRFGSRWPREQWLRHRRSKHHHLAMPRARPLRLARRHRRHPALALLFLSKRLRLRLRLSLPLRPCLPQRPRRAGLRDGRAGTGSLAGSRDGTGSLAGSRDGTGSTSRAGERDGSGSRNRLDLALRNLTLRNLALRNLTLSSFNRLDLSLRNRLEQPLASLILLSSFRSTAWWPWSAFADQSSWACRAQ